MTTLPFLTYKILPSQAIISESIRLEHVRTRILRIVNVELYAGEGRFECIDLHAGSYSVHHESRCAKATLSRPECYSALDR